VIKNLIAAITCTLLSAGVLAADSLKFGVTDITGLESLQTEYGEFAAALTEVTGKEVEFFPVNSRTAAVEAMAGGNVDFILTGPAEYIVFRARAKAVPVVAWQRLDYFTQIVTTNDSGIGTIDDLKGKRIAFGDVGSTSTVLPSCSG
jgi:phosphonate transport system substrate-binding protein